MLQYSMSRPRDSVRGRWLEECLEGRSGVKREEVVAS